jgi:hypothetical protein
VGGLGFGASSFARIGGATHPPFLPVCGLPKKWLYRMVRFLFECYGGTVEERHSCNFKNKVESPWEG